MQECRHKLIFNTQPFSTATMVRRMRLNITLYEHCMYCLFSITGTCFRATYTIIFFKFVTCWEASVTFTLTLTGRHCFTDIARTKCKLTAEIWRKGRMAVRLTGNCMSRNQAVQFNAVRPATQNPPCTAYLHSDRGDGMFQNLKTLQGQPFDVYEVIRQGMVLNPCFKA
jgi:hypothetical protein